MYEQNGVRFNQSTVYNDETGKHMNEYSRIVIENFCMTHNSAKSRRLQALVDLSYDPAAEGTDNDTIYLERAISREKDPELRKALDGTGKPG